MGKVDHGSIGRPVFTAPTSSQQQPFPGNSEEGSIMVQDAPPPYDGTVARQDFSDEQYPRRQDYPVPSIFAQPRAPANKPIAIPATTAKYGSPFLRAYPPSLAAYSISPDIFLTFLDNLNRAAVKSPPLQALDLAGNVVSMMPSAAAQITGGVVGLTASVTAGVLQRGLTENELKRANTELFGPRGLVVEIAKTAALAKIAGIQGVLDAEGKIDKRSKLLQPLTSEDIDPVTSMSAQTRRLQALQPWIAELQITAVPQVAMPTNALSRVHARASEKERAKGERKMLEDRSKSERDYEEDSGKARAKYDKDTRENDDDLRKKLSKLDRKIVEAQATGKTKDNGKLEEDRDKALRKHEEEQAKIECEYAKESGKVEKNRLKDDKEEKSIRKLNWLVIRRAITSF
jgi:hypothetical protein